MGAPADVSLSVARVALAATTLAIAGATTCGCPAVEPRPPSTTPSEPRCSLGELRLVARPDIGPQVREIAADAARGTLVVATFDARLAILRDGALRAAWPLTELMTKGRCATRSHVSGGFGFIDVGISRDGSE